MDSLVKSWLDLDQDEESRSEIEQLLKRNDQKELKVRLGTRLSFGTAGLRARMGAGFSRMNSLTIIQTSQGLAEYLLSAHPDTCDAGIVIGYDGRHKSSRFAQLAAAVFIHKKIKIWWNEDVVHTPLVPFAVKHLKAAGGIMITASHNPAQDNGFKVYGSSGCQINTPIDEQIADMILQNLEPVTWDIQTIETSPLKTNVRESLMNLYAGLVWNQVKWESFSSLPSPIFPSFVYTPLHGVGLPFMQQAIGELICPIKGAEHPPINMVVVSEQASPDPDFPTVRFPNPEEDGALDLAKTTADQQNISIIIANDPDADRLAVAEKVNGEWIQFTGDQLGVLLAHFALSQTTLSEREDGEDQSTPGKKLFVLASAVSSQMLAVVAADAGISFEETLTGFKWLGSRALQIRGDGNECIFACEEALGYMFPSIVYDKDGISAASAFLSACAQWGSPWAKMQELYEKYGFFVTMNTYWRSSDISRIPETFNKIRESGKPHPQQVANRKVLRWRDLITGYDSSTNDRKPCLPTSAGGQMITCWLAGQPGGDVRATIRASGTEPKIKLYLECRDSVEAQAEAGAESTLRWIAQEWFQDDSLIIEERYIGLVS